MAKIRVFKPFLITHANGGETKFAPGDHEVSDEIAAHPYIAEHHADGRVESPAQRAEREASEAEAAKARAAEGEALRKKAEDDLAATQLRSEQAAAQAKIDAEAGEARAAQVAEDTAKALKSPSAKK